MADTPNPVTFDTREAPAYLGMSVSWICQSRMARFADGPPYLKIGKRVRYLKTDLDEWMGSRRRQTDEVA